jgi:hypothetical protein
LTPVSVGVIAPFLNWAGFYCFYGFRRGLRGNSERFGCVIFLVVFYIIRLCDLKGWYRIDLDDDNDPNRKVCMTLNAEQLWRKRVFRKTLYEVYHYLHVVPLSW